MKVLDATGYLTEQSDRTFRRLNETFEMVLDSLESIEAMQVGGRGWRSILRVRLLHSSVRLRILSKSTSSSSSSNGRTWRSEKDGLPINQEDMMGTLLAFSINVLDSIKRIGGPKTLRFTARISCYPYFMLNQ